MSPVYASAYISYVFMNWNCAKLALADHDFDLTPGQDFLPKHHQRCRSASEINCFEMCYRYLFVSVTCFIQKIYFWLARLEPGLARKPPVNLVSEFMTLQCIITG